MLIILDLDGTIINSESTHYKSFLKAIKLHGFKLNAEQKKGITSKFGMVSEDIIKGILPNVSDKMIDDIANDVKKISVSEGVSEMKFINGTKKFLLDNYKKHDLALATNSSKTFTIKVLESLKIDKFFKKIVTASDVKNPKPDSEMIDLIIKYLNYKKSDAVFIGDSIFDYQSAKNANIRFIAVLSKSDYKKELKKVAECFFDLSKVNI